MQNLKTVVGELKGKGESKGRVTLEIDCGTKFPVNISTFTTIGKNDPRPNPLLEQIEAVKPGMKVEAVYTENPGKNATGGDVIYKNLYGISIASDSTPVKGPDNVPVAKTASRADGQTGAKREYESIEDKRRAIGMTSCFNNACTLYAPIMLADFNNGRVLDADGIDRHLKNVDALARGLADYLFPAIGRA